MLKVVSKFVDTDRTVASLWTHGVLILPGSNNVAVCYVKSLLHDIRCHGRIVDETVNKATALSSATGFSCEADVASIKTRYDNLLAVTQVCYIIVSHTAR